MSEHVFDLVLSLRHCAARHCSVIPTVELLTLTDGTVTSSTRSLLTNAESGNDITTRVQSSWQFPLSPEETATEKSSPCLYTKLFPEGRTEVRRRE